MKSLDDLLLDPLRFHKLCWPDARLYDKQVEIMNSVRDNRVTIVPAGNDLGKDYIAARIVIWFFCSRQPCIVVTHSVDQSQLKNVLWGEMRHAISTSQFKLPLYVGDDISDIGIRYLDRNGNRVPKSYVIGRVTRKGEGLLGHHQGTKDIFKSPRTLFVGDEVSGVDDEAWEKVDSWAHRKLGVGNCYPCSNFFYHACKEGNKRDEEGRLEQNVIRIRGEDSPNVRRGAHLKKQGISDHEAHVQSLEQVNGWRYTPGLLSYQEYVRRRRFWDPIQQCIGLDAQHYEGAEFLMFPPQWLDAAERLETRTAGRNVMGVDPAEGGDSTSWAIVNASGLVDLISKKTPDTSVITGQTLALMRQYKVAAHDVLFDRGGGGKQHVDRLRAQGYAVRSIGFGESVSPEPKHGTSTVKTRKEEREEKYAYKNRRAEMYHLLRLRLELDDDRGGSFALPSKLLNREGLNGRPSLRNQLAPIPLDYDSEGRLYLPSKSKKMADGRSQSVSAVKESNTKEKTLIDIIGCSPDEADALVLAVYGLDAKTRRMSAGVM